MNKGEEEEGPEVRWLEERERSGRQRRYHERRDSVSRWCDKEGQRNEIGLRGRCGRAWGREGGGRGQRYGLGLYGKWREERIRGCWPGFEFERLTYAGSQWGRTWVPRWRCAREKEKPNCMERSMEKRGGRPLHTQPLTPPEFRNSGAQIHVPRTASFSTCFTSKEIVQINLSLHVCSLFSIISEMCLIINGNN